MNRTIFAAALFLLGAASAGVSVAAPSNGAQLDAKILKACATEGGKPAECVCGLKIAKGEGDTFTKLGLGLNAAKAAGYTEQEAMGAVMAVANQSNRAEKECKAS